MPSFLNKVEALRISEDGKIDIEDVYTSDKDFQEFIDRVAYALKKFSVKFNVQEAQLREILFKQVKE